MPLLRPNQRHGYLSRDRDLVGAAYGSGVFMSAWISVPSNARL